MALNFNKYVQDGEQFVREVARELGVGSDLPKAGRILRAVLHTLRNRLTASESLQLIAQLPMLIKAVYVDGWHISAEARTLRHLGDFKKEVESSLECGASRTFNFSFNAFSTLGKCAQI